MTHWNSKSIERRLRLRIVIVSLLLCLSFCLSSLATGQTVASNTAFSSILGAPIITNYDAKIYKAHSQNWVSIQDQRGIIYFGNSSGLIEFDGQRWRTVATKGNPMIRALAIGSDQTIYYGSIGDFGYLAVNASGKLQAISLFEQIPKSDNNFNDVWQIEATSHGVYFLTRTHIFRLYQGKISVLDGKFASSQAVVIDDHLVYIDSQRGLSLIDEGKIIPLPEFAKVANGKRIVLARFAPHKIIAGRATGDFLILDLSSLWNSVTKKYRPEMNPKFSANASADKSTSDVTTSLIQKFPTELDGLTNYENLFLYKLIPAGENLFAISTVKGGVLILDKNGKVQRAITRNAGLLDNTVAGVMLDRANNLWAATNSGISHIELSSPQSLFNARNGIEGISISSIFHRGEFYVGTYQHVLKQAPYTYAPKQDAPLFSVIPDSPGEVWQFKEVAGDLMLASSRGLYTLADNRTTRIDGSGTDGYALGTSARWPEHVFMGKMGGIEVFRRDKGKWVLLGKINTIQENIRRITADASGDLWLTTEVQGLIRVHFQSDDPLQVGIHRLGLKNGLPALVTNRASYLDNNLYLCTAKGLYSAQIAPWQDNADQADATQFIPEMRFGKQFSDGSMTVSDISRDGDGGYLLQTSLGVQRLQKNAAGQYDTNNQAFRGIIAADEALYVHPDGSVWLPGENLYRVNMHSDKDYAQHFSTMIRKVSVNTSETIFDGTYGAQGRMFPTVATVFKTIQAASHVPQLSYTQNAIMFEFAASFYEKPGSTQFQYQLEGFDPSWSEWSLVNTKEYTNLPEGQYRFRVHAKNIYGSIGSSAIYQLTILPPWYRSVWAYLLWFTIASTSIFGGIRLYTRHLRANKKILENEIIERTREAVMQKEAADQARHKIALLAEMGRQITASLEIHAIQKSLYTYVLELIPGNTFGIGIVDNEHKVIRFDYVIENGKPVRPYQRSLEAREQPATQCVLSAQELLFNELTLDTRELDSFIGVEFDNKQIKQADGSPSPMPRSAIYVPMMLKHQVIGVISVQSDDPHTYHENDLAILRSLGAYAAVAFDNAHSYHRLQLTQSKLVEQEKLAALGALVAGVAHELNTPIGNSLLTASSLDEITAELVRDINGGSVRRSRFENFGTQAKSACTLLMRNLENAANLITSFKQIAVDQTSDKRRVFNLNTVTNEIGATLGGRIRRDHHHLSIQIPEHIEMDGYPGSYGQVITNMILNALIHAFDGKEDGQISISVSKFDRQQVTMHISDNGNGISEDNLNRIFDPFFTTRMGQGGSGLGLHISYNIVTAILGGSIQVKSRLGHGTQFDITLPTNAPESPLQDSAPED